VWDVRQAGYLIGIDPKHYTAEAASKFVSDIMDKTTKGKCPPLRMIYSSPRIQVDERQFSSKAYAIEFESQNSKEVMRKLRDAFSGSTLFLMAKLRFTHPNSFANALKMQNQLMTQISVLPMVNISPDEYFYLQPMIEGIEGVKAVVETRTSLTHGRYNILIASKQFREVKDKLSLNFDTYYHSAVSEEVKQNPEMLKYSGVPGILSGNDNDEESSGAVSFLSMSAASFASFDTSDAADAYDSFIPAAGTYTWSQVVQEGKQPAIPKEVTTPTPVPKVPAATHASYVVSPSDEQYPTSKIKRLREEYEQKLNNNATEIAELKTMLKQVLSTLSSIGIQQGVAPSTVTDPPVPEPMDTSGPQKRGGTESPNRAENSRNKRLDHKSSPTKKTDFCEDE
jgi:hypothetical protein